MAVSFEAAVKDEFDFTVRNFELANHCDSQIGDATF